MSKTTKKTTPKPAEPEQGGYRGQHVEGSREGKVHELFNKQGAEAAWTLGLKLKLKEGTLRSWFGQWRRADEKAKPKAKPAPKSKPAKAVPVHWKSSPGTKVPKAVGTPSDDDGVACVSNPHSPRL
jgi:hypothetical protein